MGRGYAEGPAVEAAEEERERLALGSGDEVPVARRSAVFGSTRQDPTPHFLGWTDEVDADELFVSGVAWGITRRTVPATIDPGTRG